MEARTAALRAVGETVLDRMERHRPRGCAELSVAVQSWHATTGRFAEGRVSDLTVRRGQATAARYVLADGLRYRCAAGLDPSVAGGPGAGGGAGTAGGPGTAGEAPVPGDDPPPEWLELSRVLRTLAEIEEAARGFDPRVAQVVIDFELSDQSLFLGRPGVRHDEHRLLSYLVTRVIARDGGRVSTGFYTPGASGALAALDARQTGVEVARRAVTGLGARPAPVGHLPVVVGAGRGMVLLHEACCHPLEGDEVLRDSVYAGRLGQRVAAVGVTLHDDATVAGAVGSYRHDDEGTPAGRTTLIEDGVLRGYLTDRDSAARLGLPPSGNGRCTTVLHPPQPRMSNTCLAPGTATAEEIISDTPLGIYAQHVGGGEVVESTGEFTFRVTNGYLIENGRVTAPIGETTVTGLGTRVLADIDAVADDVTVGAARCGKFGQWVPVGVVGPTLRVRSLLVGGVSR